MKKLFFNSLNYSKMIKTRPNGMIFNMTSNQKFSQNQSFKINPSKLNSVISNSNIDSTSQSNSKDNLSIKPLSYEEKLNLAIQKIKERLDSIKKDKILAVKSTDTSTNTTEEQNKEEQNNKNKKNDKDILNYFEKYRLANYMSKEFNPFFMYKSNHYVSPLFKHYSDMLKNLENNTSNPINKKNKNIGDLFNCNELFFDKNNENELFDREEATTQKLTSNITDINFFIDANEFSSFNKEFLVDYNKFIEKNSDLITKNENSIVGNFSGLDQYNIKTAQVSRSLCRKLGSLSSRLGEISLSKLNFSDRNKTNLKDALINNHAEKEEEAVKVYNDTISIAKDLLSAVRGFMLQAYFQPMNKYSSFKKVKISNESTQKVQDYSNAVLKSVKNLIDNLDLFDLNDANFDSIFSLIILTDIMSPLPNNYLQYLMENLTALAYTQSSLKNNSNKVYDMLKLAVNRLDKRLLEIQLNTYILFYDKLVLDNNTGSISLDKHLNLINFFLSRIIQMSNKESSSILNTISNTNQSTSPNSSSTLNLNAKLKKLQSKTLTLSTEFNKEKIIEDFLVFFHQNIKVGNIDDPTILYKYLIGISVINNHNSKFNNIKNNNNSSAITLSQNTISTLTSTAYNLLINNHKHFILKEDKFKFLVDFLKPLFKNLETEFKKFNKKIEFKKPKEAVTPTLQSNLKKFKEIYRRHGFGKVAFLVDNHQLMNLAKDIYSKIVDIEIPTERLFKTEEEMEKERISDKKSLEKNLETDKIKENPKKTKKENKENKMINKQYETDTTGESNEKVSNIPTPYDFINNISQGSIELIKNSKMPLNLYLSLTFNLYNLKYPVFYEYLERLLTKTNELIKDDLTRVTTKSVPVTKNNLKENESYNKRIEVFENNYQYFSLLLEILHLGVETFLIKDLSSNPIFRKLFTTLLSQGNHPTSFLKTAPVKDLVKMAYLTAVFVEEVNTTNKDFNYAFPDNGLLETLLREIYSSINETTENKNIDLDLSNMKLLVNVLQIIETTYAPKEKDSKSSSFTNNTYKYLPNSLFKFSTNKIAVEIVNQFASKRRELFYFDLPTYANSQYSGIISQNTVIDLDISNKKKKIFGVIFEDRQFKNSKNNCLVNITLPEPYSQIRKSVRNDVILMRSDITYYKYTREKLPADAELKIILGEEVLKQISNNIINSKI